jgi:hypothetical protein
VRVIVIVIITTIIRELVPITKFYYDDQIVEGEMGGAWKMREMGTTF